MSGMMPGEGDSGTRCMQMALTKNITTKVTSARCSRYGYCIAYNMVSIVDEYVKKKITAEKSCGVRKW